MPRWVAVLLLYAGCAFSISGPDSDRPRNQAPRCDTGKGLVVLDGLAAATAGVVAIAVAGESEPALALLPAAIGALYVGGAVSGNNKANACRKEMEEYASMVAARDTLDRQRPRFEHLEAERARDIPVVPPPKRPAQPQEADPRDQEEEVAAPTPAPAQPVAKPQPPARGPAKKLPPPKPKQDEEEWTDFWREVD